MGNSIRLSFGPLSVRAILEKDNQGGGMGWDCNRLLYYDRELSIPRWMMRGCQYLVQCQSLVPLLIVPLVSMVTQSYGKGKSRTVIRFTHNAS